MSFIDELRREVEAFLHESLGSGKEREAKILKNITELLASLLHKDEVKDKEEEAAEVKDKEEEVVEVKEKEDEVVEVKEKEEEAAEVKDKEEGVVEVKAVDDKPVEESADPKLDIGPSVETTHEEKPKRGRKKKASAEEGQG